MPIAMKAPAFQRRLLAPGAEIELKEPKHAEVETRVGELSGSHKQSPCRAVAPAARTPSVPRPFRPFPVILPTHHGWVLARLADERAAAPLPFLTCLCSDQ
jgi:hypothetical protein